MDKVVMYADRYILADDDCKLIRMRQSKDYRDVCKLLKELVKFYKNIIFL